MPDPILPESREDFGTVMIFPDRLHRIPPSVLPVFLNCRGWHPATPSARRARPCYTPRVSQLMIEAADLKTGNLAVSRVLSRA